MDRGWGLEERRMRAIRIKKRKLDEISIESDRQSPYTSTDWFLLVLSRKESYKGRRIRLNRILGREEKREEHRR